MKLLKFTDPALRKPPALFDFKTSDPVALADSLWDKCRELQGFGLSANQVGIDARVFVMGVDEKTKKYIFNPEIVDYSEETMLAQEGCLSYPGLWLMVRRPVKCTIAYQNVDGEHVIEEFSGLTARVALHEYDHMIGMNFTDRVSKLKLDMAFKSLNKRAKRVIQKYVNQ